VDITEFSTLLPTAGVLITLGSLYLTVRKIQKDGDKAKKEQAAEILQAAKEEIALKDKDLSAKLAALDTRIETLESSVEKDLQHLRETYNGEIRNLGQKIEDLRSELRNQHTQMVSLLTKMIDNSKD
jgi:chromosome segregation ATPase